MTALCAPHGQFHRRTSITHNSGAMSINTYIRDKLDEIVKFLRVYLVSFSPLANSNIHTHTFFSSFLFFSELRSASASCIPSFRKTREVEMNVNKYMRRSVRFYDRRRSMPFGSEWDLCTEKRIFSHVKS